MRILLTEDEKSLSYALCSILRKQKYEVDAAYNGEEGLDLALSGIYDVIVLDVMMPKMNGYELLKLIRAQYSHLPVIMLSAKTDRDDIIAAYDLGCDDYMTKPFATPELLARINVALRKRTRTEVREQSEGEVLRVKNLAMYTLRHEVMVGEESVELTKKEYDLLEMLLRNKRNVLTRDQILSDVWGYDYMGDTNVVDVYIRYLRQKLDDRFDEKYIYTMRGVGYVIKD